MRTVDIASGHAQKADLCFEARVEHFLPNRRDNSIQQACQQQY